MSFQQQELFDSKMEDNKRKTRDKHEPVEKDTDATASLFGWEFQILVAILYSIENIQNINTVIVEGMTEDIELYFDNNKVTCIQVKAVQNTLHTKTDKKKTVKAMNTLINTSNRLEGEYNNLIYACNFANPLGLDEQQQRMYWEVNMRRKFEKSYEAVPDDGKEYIKKCMEAAVADLKSKGYKYDTNYFDTSKLKISVILYDAFNESENSEKYIILENAIMRLVTEVCKLGNLNNDWSKIERIRDRLLTYYLDKGATSNKLPSKNICKKDLVWQILNSIISDIEMNDFNCPEELEFELSCAKKFFDQQINEIDNINKVISDFTNQNRMNNSTVSDFVENNWKRYMDLFSDDNDDVQEYGIRYILTRIIKNKIRINRIKEGTNLNGN